MLAASQLSILIADDHDIVRRGLCSVLGTQSGWTIVAEVTNGCQAVQQAAALQPDVAVVDLAMPELNGLEAARSIRKLSPATQVLILTVHKPASIVKEVLAAGACGLVLKSDAAEQLITAVRMAAAGQLFFSGQVSVSVTDAIAGTSAEELTPRESAIVRLVANGRSNKEIAHELAISVRTVETHRQNVMKKLQVGSTSELVRWAVRNDLADF